MNSLACRLLGAAMMLLASTGAMAANGEFCRSYGIEETKVVFLGVDRTISSTNDFDKRAIQDALSHSTNILKYGWRFKIFVIGADLNRSPVIYDDCKPGSRRDGFNMFTSTPDRPDKLREDLPRFEAEVQSVINGVSTSTVQQAKRSPIISVINRTVGPSSGQIEALVLASDLLEGAFDLLVSAPSAPITPYRQTELLARIQRENAAPNLRGAKVFAYGVGLFDEANQKTNREQLSSATADSVRSFWKGFFIISGVSSGDIHIY